MLNEEITFGALAILKRHINPECFDVITLDFIDVEIIPKCGSHFEAVDDSIQRLSAAQLD